jgi:2-oxoglutarate dehydrogenase E2 component (dihydrolipoamide succinyltransferase)
MATEIRVPELGESITEATVAQWFKNAGDAVGADEPLVELETDKVTVEVPAPAAGVLSEISVKEGDTVEVGALLGSIAEGDGMAAPKAAKEKAAAPKAAKEKAAAPKAAEKKAPVPVAEAVAEPAAVETAPANMAAEITLTPAVRKLVEENQLDPAEIAGTGKGGRILKGDVLAAIEAGAAARRAPASAAIAAPRPVPAAKPRAPALPGDEVREERVRMTRLRQTIARRLKDAQNTAAMLTTFNEVDMSAVMALRKEYRDLFEQRHGVRLGFMGFFVLACTQALKEIPEVNAEIDGTDLIYKNYYNIGIAVGTERGLVVPVIRDADKLSLAGIEQAISDFARRAQAGELSIADMQGGTFTISNGGVYGSLMSTPILNAPQSGILGMHKIEQRAVVIDGEVVARPMMYLALTYDHRVVDGQGAVTFLVRVKESLEDPQRMMLDI